MPESKSSTRPNTFAEHYLAYVESSCADGDAYPQPAMTEDREGGLAMLALALPGMGVLRHMREQSAADTVVKMAFGVDRSTRPNQGTTMSSVLTYVVVERGGEPAFGFVEYDGLGQQRQHDLVPGEFWHTALVRDFAVVLAEWAAEESR